MENKLRKYVVELNPLVNGPLAGTTEWAHQAYVWSHGALWNNGTWMLRKKMGKQSVSNHARGLAMDLSYRRMSDKGVSEGRSHALQFINTCLEPQNCRILGIQLVIDYMPMSFGRSWRCDRETWYYPQEDSFYGAPRGDWFHVEIGPKLANDPNLVKAAFKLVFGTT